MVKHWTMAQRAHGLWCFHPSGYWGDKHLQEVRVRDQPSECSNVTLPTSGLCAMAQRCSPAPTEMLRNAQIGRKLPTSLTEGVWVF